MYESLCLLSQLQHVLRDVSPCLYPDNKFFVGHTFLSPVSHSIPPVNGNVPGNPPGKARDTYQILELSFLLLYASPGRPECVGQGIPDFVQLVCHSCHCSADCSDIFHAGFSFLSLSLFLCIYSILLCRYCQYSFRDFLYNFVDFLLHYIEIQVIIKGRKEDVLWLFHMTNYGNY